MVWRVVKKVPFLDFFIFEILVRDKTSAIFENLIKFWVDLTPTEFILSPSIQSYDMKCNSYPENHGKNFETK